ELEVVRRRDGVAQRALDLLLRLERGGDRRLHVAEIVERIEDPKDVNPGLRRVLDEQLDCVIGEVARGDEVLAADERLDRRVRRRPVQLAKKVPGVFMDPELGLESRAAKCFHGGKTDGVHLGRDRNDLIGAEVSAENRLLRGAAPPAAAMPTFKPRDRAPVAHSMMPRGFRCAEQILSSCVNPRSSSTLTQASINGRSDFEPRMTPTTGCITRPPERYLSGRKP